MDTRSKILAWERFVAAAAGAPALIAGHFDPLLAGHAEQLEALAAEHGPLWVAITDPPEAILPAAVRAELVAALRVVAVVAVQGGPMEHPNRISIESADLEHRRKLTALVHWRHQPAEKS